MGDSDEIADLYVAGDTEAQKVLYSGFAKGIRVQSRTEERGQAARFATYYASLRSETCMYFFFQLAQLPENKCIIARRSESTARNFN